MKNIKTFLIGFLTCTCLFLIMGQTKAKAMDDIRTMLTQNGRYQMVSHSEGVNAGLFLVDTRNGKTRKLREVKKEWKEFISRVKID